MTPAELIAEAYRTAADPKATVLELRNCAIVLAAELARIPRPLSVEGVAGIIASWAFQACQPDKGDIFGWLDDNKDDLARAIIALTAGAETSDEIIPSPQFQAMYAAGAPTDPEQACELAVGTFVYGRVEHLMNAKAGTPEGAELAYLADLIGNVEEYDAKPDVWSPVAPADPTLSGGGEALARRFHDAYERLAPSFGYETRTDTRQFDPTTPNGKLMIAVCAEIAAPPQPWPGEDELARAIFEIPADEKVSRPCLLAAQRALSLLPGD